MNRVLRSYLTPDYPDSIYNVEVDTHHIELVMRLLKCEITTMTRMSASIFLAVGNYCLPATALSSFSYNIREDSSFGAPRRVTRVWD